MREIIRNLVTQQEEVALDERSEALFLRLASASTRVSGQALLFLIVGRDGMNNHAVLLARYPATHGMQTRVDGDTLDVEVVRNVFVRSSHAYKAAYFTDASPNKGFWNGKVVDKQINDSSREVSNYWVYDFLDAGLSLTSQRGTRKLAAGLKRAIQQTSSVEVKQTIAAAVTLLNRMDGQTISIESICTQYTLPEDTVRTIRESLDTPGMFTSTFRLDGDEFKRTLQYKSVYLDNGGILTAPANGFETTFSRTVLNVAENLVSYETQGIESDIKVKSRP